MPQKRAVKDELTEVLAGNDLDDMIEELLDDDDEVIGHKAKGGFPFKGKDSKKKAMEQLRKMKKGK